MMGDSTQCDMNAVEEVMLTTVSVDTSNLGNAKIDASPFFVIGSVRSGTTLVERILSRHSRLYVPPETFFFTFLDRLGVINCDPSSKDELQHVAQKYRESKSFAFLDLPRGQEELLMLEDATSYRDIFANLMNFLSHRAGKPRWGEKTPNNLRYVPRIREYFPSARFILVVRDGRAAIISRLKHPNWRRNLIGWARHWAEDASHMRQLMGEIDPSVLFVLRFEELLRSPEHVVREMCNFLGESFEPEMIEPDQVNSAKKRDYYRQPWMSKSTMEIDPARANDWREEYSPRKLKIVEKIAGEQLLGLGYALENPRAPGWRALYVLEQCQDIVRKIANIFMGRR